MSPSKSVPALPSSDVPAQNPSELAEPPSQTVTREGNVPFQQRSYRAGRVKQVPVKFKNETEPTPPDRIFKLASRDNCLHLLFDIFASPSPSLYIRSTLILCFSFLFFFFNTKGGCHIFDILLELNAALQFRLFWHWLEHCHIRAYKLNQALLHVF